ncbi:MAG: ABC transporter permease [Elusimicrobiota bacterium]
MNLFLSASLTLFKREVVRFVRQKNRIIGALGTPLLFWILIGSGLGKSFQDTSQTVEMMSASNYLNYFFPGTIFLILLFTSIFSTISIIEDRKEGFLQSVLVSPAPRGAIIMGKVLGGTALATGQGILFLFLAPIIGIKPGFLDILYSIAMMLLVSFSLTALGFIIAWKMDSTQGFHAIMNLFLMPLWFLSGAMFPAEGAPGWLKIVMKLNPLSYSLTGLRKALGNGIEMGSLNFPTPIFSLQVTLVFSIVVYGISLWVTHQKDS